MSHRQIACSSLPANDEPNLGDLLPFRQSCKQPVPSAATEVEMALRGLVLPELWLRAEVAVIDPIVLKRVEPISRQHCLLPVGWGESQKAPMLSGWTTHSGFSVSEVSSHPGLVACSVRCDRLWCVDFDGASAIERSRQLGLHPEGVSTWRVQLDTDLS